MQVQRRTFLAQAAALAAAPLAAVVPTAAALPTWLPATPAAPAVVAAILAMVSSASEAGDNAATNPLTAAAQAAEYLGPNYADYRCPEWDFATQWPLNVLPALPARQAWFAVSVGIGGDAISMLDYSDEQRAAFVIEEPAYLLASADMPGAPKPFGPTPHLSLYRSAHPDFLYVVDRLVDDYTVCTWYQRRNTVGA